MNIVEIRKKNTLFLVEKLFGGNKADLANAAGIDPSAMYRFFNVGDTGRNIGDSSARKIEKAAKKPKNWLDIPNWDKSENLTSEEQTGHIIPIIDWTNANEWVNGIDNRNIKTNGSVHTSEEMSNKSYALVIKNDSMMSNSPNSISVGSIISVDPELESKSETMVVAHKKGSPEPILRQIVIDGGTKYLNALNSKYPLIELTNEWEILGSVVSVTRKFYNYEEFTNQS